MDLPTLIQSALAAPFRYPPVPEITDDTVFDPAWFGPVDRLCVQFAIEEAIGAEIPCAEAELWASVGDVRATVERVRRAA